MILFWALIGLLAFIAIAIILMPLIKIPASRQQRCLLILAAAGTAFAAVGLYWHWGNAAQLGQWYSLRKKSEQLRQALGSPEQVVAKLKHHLAEQPESAQGWYLLGKLYFSQQQFTAAAQAFAKVNKLKPQDPEVLVQYAQALYFANQRRMSTHITQLLQQVLQLQEDNPYAINLLAIDAYQHKRYQEAINFWRRLLTQYPPNSDDYQAVSTAIANAEMALKPTR